MYRRTLGVSHGQCTAEAKTCRASADAPHATRPPPTLWHMPPCAPDETGQHRLRHDGASQSSAFQGTTEHRPSPSALRDPATHPPPGGTFAQRATLVSIIPMLTAVLPSLFRLRFGLHLRTTTGTEIHTQIPKGPEHSNNTQHRDKIRRGY